jgi:hypothetical protein
VLDCSGDDRVLLFEVVTLDIPLGTDWIHDRVLGFYSRVSVVPCQIGQQRGRDEIAPTALRECRGLRLRRGESPAHDHESNRCPEDSHSKKVVVRVLLVELLHHDGHDDTSDVRPEIV